MRRYLALAILAALVAAGTFALAQTKRPAKRAAGQSPTAAGREPSRATVESFLRHVFGWDSAIKFAIQRIGSSGAAGISQITLDVESPQGKSTQNIMVMRDEKHAILGAMMPFPGTGGGKPSEEAINSFVRTLTGSNPAVTWTIVEVKPNAVSDLTEVMVILTTAQGRGPQRFWVTSDGKYAVLGDLGPFGADPYAATREELAHGINGPSKGPAKAAVTIVEFGDLQCPSCKAAAPTVERLLKDEPNARLVFQQFPLTQIHAWAFKAAEFGDCIAHENNAAFWKFMDAVYANQEQITSLVGSGDMKQQQAQVEPKVVPRLKELAGQSGVDINKVMACSADPSTAKRIDQSVNLGKAMQITGTPTLFVNGRKIASLGQMPYETLKKLVEFMATPAAK